MTELKPCPFYGGVKISMHTYDIASDCFIMCDDCGALIEKDVSWSKPEDNGNVGFMSREEHDEKCKKVLAEAWNRRTHDR